MAQQSSIDNSWSEQRAIYQKEIDKLNVDHNIPLLIDQLNKAVATYINSGGVQNSNANTNYQDIVQRQNKINIVKDKYRDLLKDIHVYMSKAMQGGDLKKFLTGNGELQVSINNLQKHYDDIKIDADSAIARDELLRSKDTDITSHQLFLLDRPVRRGMIPYLWAIGILFIGVGLIIFKMMFPNVQTDSFLPMIMEFFSNPMVLISLLVAAGITILFLSLKVAGVFG